MASNVIHTESKIDIPSTNDDEEEEEEKTPHHNITVVLKEIACSPIPPMCSHGINQFKQLINDKSSRYNRENYLQMINRSIRFHQRSDEELEDIVEKLEASRGYLKDDINNFLKQIEDHHGYDQPQMTKMLEKLNETDHYAILHYATIFNNVPFCQIIIEQYHCNVNLVGWDGETPLHIAARLNEISQPNQNEESSVLLYLLKQPKVKKNIRDSEGRTPLHLAIMYNCYDNAKYLISNGVQLDLGDIQGSIPLHYACRFHQNIELIQLFLPYPILFDCETKDKKKAIDICAEYGNIDLLKHLFNLKEFRKIDEDEGVVALINAAVCHRENEVLSFLKKQHNHLLHRHLNTLHFACRQLHGHKMVSHLIDEQSLLYQDTKSGSSPLMVAVQHRQLECVQQLLIHRYCTEHVIQLVSQITLQTVFHICAQVNHDEITNELCQPRYLSNLLILAGDLQGDTPLHISAKVGNHYMTKRLIDFIQNNSFSTTAEVIPIPTTTTFRSMTNLDTNGRIPSKVSPSSKKDLSNESVIGSVQSLLMKKNKEKLTPLHVAIHYGNVNVIKEIIPFSTLSVINAHDDQLRTSLHMAAEKGHVDILKILLSKGGNADACDINDWTPLHNAARCSINEDDNKERAQCIEILVNDGKGNINALNIRRETPLHIASEYGSKTLIKRLRILGADLFATNVDGLNCLEVAIEQGNEEVVRYLIEDECGFDLMRNAQIHDKKSTWSFSSLLKGKDSSNLSFVDDRQRKADTPMRKLIHEMPKMALLLLNKCSMIVGTIGTSVHKNIFIYEFLEDQYTVDDWEEGNFGVPKQVNNRSRLYTSNKVDLVRNHPLFLMGSCSIPDLMSHPLSSYLVKQKFYKFGIYIFSLFILFYLIYLSLLTTVSLRTEDPQTYYNLTNFASFDDSLCLNVSQALINGSSNLGGRKTTIDYIFKYVLYIFIWLHIIKNVLIIIEIIEISLMKSWNYLMELSAVALSFAFVYDQSYQMNLTFRCPYQWQYGALALLLSWLCLLHYIQFLPIIGIYVSMLWVICKKFMKFFCVLIVLISGFAFSFHMIFQNSDVFNNAGLSFIKTGLMIAGDMTYENQMYDSNTIAYYKIGYLLYVMFAVLMAILVTNLLIGLAVGDIPPLMEQASDERNRLFFELVADLEIFRYQLVSFLCCFRSTDAMSYSFQDLNQKSLYERWEHRLLKFFSGSRKKNDQSDSNTEDQLEQQTLMLKSLKKQMKIFLEKDKRTDHVDSD